MIIKQKTPDLTLLEYELDEDALVLRQKSGSERLQTRFNYSTLMPDADHRAGSERKWLYFAIFQLCVAVFFGAAASGESREREISIVFTMFMLVFLVTTAVFIFKFLRSRFDVLSYLYPNGGLAFIIWRNLPDEQTFAPFIAGRTGRIKQAREAVRAAASPDSLSTEIDRLGTLRDKGLLTEEEFARAKASLLDQLERGGRVMGFHQ